MTSRKSAILLSLLSGLFMATMVRLNASLGRDIGALESTFVVHLVGALAAVVMCGHYLHAQWRDKMRATPVHLFLGGIIGASIVWMANIVVPRLGMALSSSIFIASSLVFSCFVDHHGLLGLSQIRITFWRVCGIIVTVCGVVLIYL